MVYLQASGGAVKGHARGADTPGDSGEVVLAHCTADDLSSAEDSITDKFW